MTVFLCCQGMAQAMPSVMYTGQSAQQADVMPCHQAEAKSKVECPSDCQHIVKAVDGGAHNPGDHAAPMALLLTLPALTADAGSTIKLASLPRHDPVADPPPLLRFLHFRE